MSIDRMLDVVQTMKKNRLGNYIVPGLESALLGDGKDGGKVRLFSTDRATRDSITPHSHRFDFACLVLRGYVHNTLYEPPTSGMDPTIAPFVLSVIDQVCGADGIRDFVHTRESEARQYRTVTTEYKKGEFYYMHHSQIHSIVFGPNTRVMFVEGPQVTPTGFMLEPWVNGKVVPTFKTEDWMFEKLD